MLTCTFHTHTQTTKRNVYFFHNGFQNQPWLPTLVATVQVLIPCQVWRTKKKRAFLWYTFTYSCWPGELSTTHRNASLHYKTGTLKVQGQKFTKKRASQRLGRNPIQLVCYNQPCPQPFHTPSVNEKLCRLTWEKKFPLLLLLHNARHALLLHSLAEVHKRYT